MFRRFMNELEEGIISLLLASMTLLVFVEVVLRFGFNTGLLWAQELTLLLSAWMVLFGVSYGVKVGSHIGVDAVVRLLPPKTKRIVSAIACVLALIYCGLFLKGSYVYLAKMHLIGIELEDIPIPKWVGHSILIFGFLLLAFRILELLWRIIQGKAEGFSLHDEARDARGMYEGKRMEDDAENGEAANP
ncbi:TRAP transporter small permease [Oceanidesulfovibrio marinus]|uniref:TRAP transporter small permease n=2 Tax=Oceanidesulfovibrio marinus TaxID=370038 RepID=A0A6P1ZQL6_9BACT|nr:TRAP transporter small permease [Oceanidesulfovibrio marinus]TVM36767.1 TRAP transporter small permease [Oceanidesulfovibrio marinus]